MYLPRPRHQGLDGGAYSGNLKALSLGLNPSGSRHETDLCLPTHCNAVLNPSVKIVLRARHKKRWGAGPDRDL